MSNTASPTGTTDEPLSADPQAAFAELGKIMLGSQPLTETLARVAELARSTIPGAREVSVTLIEDDRARTVVFTGNVAFGLDERQYGSGFGPCMDAAGTGETITIEDTATDDRYPDFSREARHFGVGHTLSIGMPVPQRIIGALNIYGGSGPPFDAAAQELALTFASYAAVAIANAALYSSTAELAAQLQRAMASRAVIEQAKGILMAQQRITADAAFGKLAQASQVSNRKLRDIAQEIVTRLPQQEE